MKAFLNRVRSVDKELPFWKQLLLAVSSLFLGILLGSFSKYLDSPPAELPYLLGKIDDWLEWYRAIIFIPIM